MLRMIIAASLADRVSRDRARYAIINRMARRWGFRLYAQNARWFDDEEFLNAWRGFPDPQGTIHDRRYNLYGLAKAFSDVPGDMAECGVYRGRGAHLMLTATEGTGKHLFAFDSFEGLSQPSDEDNQHRDPGEQWTLHHFASDEQIAQRNLEGHGGRVSLFKGWIPERFGEVSDREFSFVHIDVDLYHPTKDSVEFFYERLSPGGVLVCDDYGSVACPGAKKAVDEFADRVGIRPAPLATGQVILLAPRA